MKNNSKDILIRWTKLRSDSEMSRVCKISQLLTVASFLLFIISISSLLFHWHSYLVWFCAFSGGFVQAEAGALKNRVQQWPTFKQYIDWKQVEKDLNS